MKGKIAIKSGILVILILLSVLQIEKLWFEESSSHSFFRLFERQDAADLIFQDLIFEPNRIALYRAENRGEYLELDPAGIPFLSLQRDTLKLIRRLPQMQALESFSYEELYGKAHILFDFGYPLSLGVKSSDAKEKSIQRMIILPADLEESQFGILFFNENLELVSGFKMAKTELEDENELFSASIKTMPAVGDRILYSAKQQGLKNFEAENLLPSQNQELILPLSWNYQIAFIKGQEQKRIDKENLSEYVYSYVNNPKILWDIVEEQRVRYGDSSVLMEYNQMGVFSYRYIQAVSPQRPQLSAGEALKRAQQFLSRDLALQNQEIKLADYQFRQGKHYFYYDYSFRGQPLLWNHLMQERYQMLYPMEIIVEKDVIAGYRRLLIEMDLLKQGSHFKVNYEDALNLFFQNHEQSKIRYLDLNYYIEENQIKLGWFIRTANEQAVYPVKMEEKNELE